MCHKKVSGKYGGTTEGIYLFEDGKFLLYGYATMIFGSYAFEKEYFRFYPDKPDHTFVIFGRKNKNITNGMKVNFKGFERGTTFIQFDNGSTKRVFNENANCFSTPYVWETSYIPKRIRLTHIFDEYWYRQPTNTESFTPDKDYNDFIMFYNKPDYYREPFDVSITTEGDIAALRTTLTATVYEMQRDDEDGRNEWLDAEQLKTDYYRAQEKGHVLFANNHYKLFFEADDTEYVYDQASDQYISRHAYDEKIDYNHDENDDYNSDTALKKYMQVKPAALENKEMKSEDIDVHPVFYTTCNEPEKSYKYKGFKEKKETAQDPLPITMPAPPLE